ncbi:MAG: glycosyltransferase family 4 protein [Bacillota bacterium]
MKIAVDMRSAYTAAGTGIGTYTSSLLDRLPAYTGMHEFIFFIPAEINPPALPADIIFIGCPPSKKEAQSFISGQLQCLKPDVYFMPQNGLRFPREKNCRWVATIHDLIPYRLPSAINKGYFLRFLEEVPRLVKTADRIITVSRSTASDLQKFFYLPDEKIRVIPLGPGPGFYPRPGRECRDALAGLYPALRPPFLLYVGGFNPRKNVPFLILAFSRARLHFNRPHQLVIAGDDPARLPALKSMTEALAVDQDVYFPGRIPDGDLPLFYNAASLLVYPSLYEGFGLPPLEAMACGTPVLTSNTSSLPEVTGRAGKSCNPDDLAGFCHIMEEIVNNPGLAEKMRARSLRRAGRFDWENILPDILKALTAWP